jgi:ACS family hexuronate transporter-like MFS transporter
VLSRRTAWTVAIIATLTMTVSYVDRTTLAVLAPTVTKELGISETAYGWLTSAFSVAYLIATPAAGWWIDRAGARRGLAWSVLVWSGIAAMHAVAPGFGILFALRIALGAAEGPGFPGAAQTMQRVLAPHDRERGFGVLFTGSSIGAMIAPPLATLLFVNLGWRTAFVGTAVVGLLWIPLWLVVTRSPAVRARLDLTAIPESALVTTEARPGVLELLRHPAVGRAIVAIFATAPVFGFIQGWGAKYLVRAWHLEQADVGGYLWLPPLLLDIGAILFGDLASRQRRAPGAPPRALYAVATVLASGLALTPLTASPWQAMILIGMAMAGGGAMYTLVTSDLLARMPPNSVSFAGGILAGAQSLVFIIVNPIIGWSVEQTAGYDVATIAIGCWAIPGSIVWLLWKPPVRNGRAAP